MASPEYPLPACDPDVRIERFDDGWWVGCQEDFCQREECYPTFTYQQAQKWRTAHRKLHREGRATVTPTFRTAYEMSIGCQCQWAGEECCPVHVAGGLLHV